ncbi:MAG: hypothetical protein AAB434_05035 [Planctomycetota bacterium]
MPRIFLAGIIQGSLPGLSVHPQTYRDRLKSILAAALPDAEVFCPVEGHPNSPNYTKEKAREVFFHHIGVAASSDLVVAFCPEASMGTAIEMYEAYRNGVPVVCISPMETNWSVRLLSERVLPDLAAFEAFARDGGLARLIAARRPR